MNAIFACTLTVLLQMQNLLYVQQRWLAQCALKVAVWDINQ